MHLAVVFDLLVALDLDRRTIIERKRINRVLKVLFLDEYALKCLGIEAESRASLQTLFVRI